MVRRNPRACRCHIRIQRAVNLGLAWLLLGVPSLGAHEPIFGLGPHVIFQGGVGVEVEFERSGFHSPEGEATEWGFHTEILYGVTEDFSLTLAVPALVGSRDAFAGESFRSTGVGDISLRGKYRFWRRDRPGTQDSAAVLAGVKLPTARTSRTPPLGSGSVDYLFGLAAARESRRYYAFADVRLRVNTTGAGGRRRGRELAMDLAVGLRPWLSGYRQPDLVVLLEFSGLDVARTRIGS